MSVSFSLYFFFVFQFLAFFIIIFLPVSVSRKASYFPSVSKLKTAGFSISVVWYFRSALIVSTPLLVYLSGPYFNSDKFHEDGLGDCVTPDTALEGTWFPP